MKIASVLRRSAGVCAAAACAIAAAPHAVHAQSGYPSRPVRIIIPSAPGGGLDALSRIVGQKLHEKLRVPFVIDNRPGAGGTIGIEAAARATPDGYTIIIISATHTATTKLQGKGAIDLTRDFAPVIWATTQPYIVNVNPQVPAHTVPELIALAKAKSESVSYGSPGAGSAQHLAGVLFGELSGSKLFHVPYRGGSQVVNDLIGGQIHMSFTNYVVCRPHIQSGKLRALAVTTAKRSKALPELPALSEFLPGYDADNWYGYLAPAKTPAPILDTLHREISALLEAPDVKPRLAVDSSEVVSVSRAQFARHIRDETAKWTEVIRKAGIKTH
jgi:tripartite-type tricarboxylate transporter receptor subunit TctC